MHALHQNFSYDFRGDSGRRRFNENSQEASGLTHKVVHVLYLPYTICATLPILITYIKSLVRYAHRVLAKLSIPFFSISARVVSICGVVSGEKLMRRVSSAVCFGIERADRTWLCLPLAQAEPLEI